MAKFHPDDITSEDYGYGYEEKQSYGYTPGPPIVVKDEGSSAVPPPAYAQSHTMGVTEPDQKKKSFPRDFIERVCTNVNYDLLVSKTFYFFFFAAFGSLFPLIGVYFKQLGMNPAQAGMLIGFRPFVELIATPFWGNLADKWKKWRTILLLSMFCWVFFTLSLAFVQPAAHSCLVHNGTDIFVATPFTIDAYKFADMKSESPDQVPQERRKRGTMPDSFQYYAVLGPVLQPVRTTHRRWRRGVLGKGTKEPPKSESKHDEGGTDDVVNKENPVREDVNAPSRDDTEGKDDSSPSQTKDQVNDNNDNELKSDNYRHDDPKKTKNSKSGNKNDKDDDDDENDDDDKDDDKSDDDDDDDDDEKKLPKMTYYQFKKFPYPEIETLGMSPLPLNHRHISNLDASMSVDLVSPPMSAVVYRIQDIQSVFLVLLVLQVVGEFLSTPAITMADTATLGYLGDDAENYGRQRMYGSLGWALSMFFVGIALDYSDVFSRHPCGTKHLVDRNYMTCYAVFSVLMCCAFLAATQFRFKEVDSAFQTIPLADLKNKVVEKVQKTLKGEDPFGFGKSATPGATAEPAASDPKVRISLEGQGQQGDMISDAAHVEEIPATRPSPFIPRGQPGQAGTLPQWIQVLRMFAPIQYSSMLFILWYMGFGIGLVFAFLFWHLQDLHGSPTLFGISSVINHMSEIAAFFFIRNIVARFGKFCLVAFVIITLILCLFNFIFETVTVSQNLLILKISEFENHRLTRI